ncbi:GrpB family protein [Lacicoccus alkaliphilus]|uniref:GrpB domain, predicted nucleotidyltransferase, UPF0157 family n=1 Tax=Lacicoccus alkaliphilus DSM 16010 TaxID=1123231 RepID=A0A1M7JAH3_9BACL|nr:GrpB family protein [Salinicoccus alkaliphilus]SHM50015.1 GrpB domain, predicted nucleotidyltransferase, UPF0157 family [Salinicoccus alkaliphilus DSM 16010]
MLTMNEYYNITKHHYMEASMEMLEHFRENVIEVHHIGSTSIKEVKGYNDIDVLVILKTITDVSDLAEILMAEGYEIVEDFNRYFSEETIARGKFGAFNVNFIFTPRNLNKKSQILFCKKVLKEDQARLSTFQTLKKQYDDGELNEDQYEERKRRFFSDLLDSAADLKSV